MDRSTSLRLRWYERFGEDTLLAIDLRRVLRTHGKEYCERCGHRIGWGDLAWNSASTEYGTGYSFVEIICESCQHEVAKVFSWLPWIDGREDVLRILYKDWEAE